MHHTDAFPRDCIADSGTSCGVIGGVPPSSFAFGHDGQSSVRTLSTSCWVHEGHGESLPGAALYLLHGVVHTAFPHAYGTSQYGKHSIFTLSRGIELDSRLPLQCPKDPDEPSCIWGLLLPSFHSKIELREEYEDVSSDSNKRLTTLSLGLFLRLMNIRPGIWCWLLKEASSFSHTRWVPLLVTVVMTDFMSVIQT